MKALSVICSIMITAVPSVLLAQNKPYPDFDFIAKTAQPAPQNELFNLRSKMIRRAGSWTILSVTQTWIRYASARMNAALEPAELGVP